MATYADNFTRRTCAAVATGAVVAAIATAGALLVIDGQSAGQPSSVSTGSQAAQSTQASTVTPSTPNPEIPSGSNIGNMGTGGGPVS